MIAANEDETTNNYCAMSNLQCCMAFGPTVFAMNESCNVVGRVVLTQHSVRPATQSTNQEPNMTFILKLTQINQRTRKRKVTSKGRSLTNQQMRWTVVSQLKRTQR